VDEPLVNSRRSILKATHTPIAMTDTGRERLRAPQKRALLQQIAQSVPDISALIAETASDDAESRVLRQTAGLDRTQLRAQLQAAARTSSESVLRLAQAALRRLAGGGSGRVVEGPSARRLTLATSAFRSQAATEPIGYLHLEKVAFTPVGTERGEMVHSVPLAPGEEVNIVHREWSNISQEFERFQRDVLEDFSETGVVEKSELQLATENQYQHTTQLSASVNISGSYGSVSFAAAGSASASTSASRSETFSRNETREVTNKAARRTVKEHTQSFRVTSASGVEDQAVKRFKNPSRKSPMRVDYYRMMRKWSVDLFRYGIRLTYDITIPEPGSDLLARILEIQEIEQTLLIGFGAPNGPEWAQFTVKPTDLTVAQYADIAAQYGAIVDDPPSQSKDISKTNTHQFATWDQSQGGGAYALEMQVDPQYVVASARGLSAGWEWPGWLAQFQRDATTVDDAYASGFTVGQSGAVAVPYAVRYASTFRVTVSLTLDLRPSAFAAWQAKAWSAIRDAAERRYFDQRAVLQGRLTDLRAGLAGQDTLTLRQMEREEVMKGSLRWLLGPGFAFNEKEESDYYDQKTEAVKDVDTWNVGLVHGAVVRFLQQAIEWENMLYVVYPYFWSSQTGRGQRIFMEHPDPLHRSFLRSGAARVVLTIRPGFVDSFLAFVAGDAVPPPQYLTIGQEMEAFSRTNYPGIRPANAIEDARPLLSRRQRQTWDGMQLIARFLDQYEAANGRYPTTNEGLPALLPLAQQAGVTLDFQDAWGNPYAYVAPGDNGDYDLSSPGQDGKAGGTGEDSDITSWAEASLVGQWYEYTPTSALDIEVVPEPDPTGDGDADDSDG
jgi:type II secretion system protein G